MAMFKIGQRVKKINFGPYDPRGSAPIGSEGVIIRIGSNEGLTWAPAPQPEYMVKYDGDRLGMERGALGSMLEPIQYDGNQAITWDACCWRPPHVVVEETLKECQEANAAMLKQVRRSAIWNG